MICKGVAGSDKSCHNVGGLTHECNKVADELVHECVCWRLGTKVAHGGGAEIIEMSLQITAL